MRRWLLVVVGVLLLGCCWPSHLPQERPEPPRARSDARAHLLFNVVAGMGVVLPRADVVHFERDGRLEPVTTLPWFRGARFPTDGEFATLDGGR
ncbi:MAG: hypothetical protein ACOZQL_19980 [Myxococcota bacterium]